MNARRGFTLLEVALSVALLSATAATIIGGFGSIQTLDQRQRSRLDAIEVAHKLILQYTSMGPDTLPGPNEYIEQGKARYTYRLSEDILVEKKANREGLTRREAVPASHLTPSERIQAGLVMVTIKVYHYTSGGHVSTDDPLVSLSRIFDPFPLDAGEERTDVLLRHVRRLLGIKIDIPEDLQGGAP